VNDDDTDAADDTDGVCCWCCDSTKCLDTLVKATVFRLSTLSRPQKIWKIVWMYCWQVNFLHPFYCCYLFVIWPQHCLQL